MAKVDHVVSQDAVCSYIWHGMTDDTRALVCLLAEISSEAAWLRWRQMQVVERVALTAALKSMIADHWMSEKRRYSQPHQETNNPPRGCVEDTGAAMGPPPSADGVV
jgi:hypothetical protein